MSDSSSSSSDDDGLLSMPVFKRRDRRADRADRTKLDFLETCLRGSDARTDLQRRIAIAELDDDDGSYDRGAGEGEGEGGGGDDDPPADEGEGGRGWDGDGDGGDADDPRREEKEDGGADMANDGVIDGATVDDGGGGAIAVPSIDPTLASRIIGGGGGSRRKKDDEDAYWARIDSFAEENANKSISGEGGGGNAKRYRYGVHTARRRLENALSGLVDCDADDNDGEDLTDDEGGKWKDGMCGMTRERLRCEAEAKSQGSSSRLGLRRMFSSSSSSSSSISRGGRSEGGGEGVADGGNVGGGRRRRNAYATRREAEDGLRSIVESMRVVNRASNARSDIVLRRMFVDRLVVITRGAGGDGTSSTMMWDVLHNFLLHNAVLSGRFAITLPASFCEWMWRVACSSFDVGKHCSTAACNLIRRFVVGRLDARDSVVDDSPAFRADLTFLMNYRMDDLVSCLVDDFGLWLEHGPMRPLEATGDGSGNAMGSIKERSLRVDVSALKNIFLIWLALFDRDLISIHVTEVDDGASIGEDASRVLVAFARVGLDPCFNEADEIYDTCGEPLLALMQRLTASLIRTTTNQISKFDGRVHVERWMKRTADLMVEACSDLSTGDEDAADRDDARGDLALAMAVKRMCTFALDTGFSVEISSMKMIFAVKALRASLTEIIDFDDKLEQRRPPADENRKLAIHALVTAEIGFEWIDEQSESLMRSHPRFLAAILIAGECAMIGAGVCWRHQNSNQSEDEPVKTNKESDAVYEIVSNIEDLCDGLKKECRAVIAYPHLRRTKEYLTRLSKEIGALKGRSSNEKGRKREQGSLDTFFSRPSMSQSEPLRGTRDS